MAGVSTSLMMLLTHINPLHSHRSSSSLLPPMVFPSAHTQVAGEFKYHPECFACMSCKVIIEDGDAYALVQHATLYW